VEPADEDANEAALAAFDAARLDVWLEVEPSEADVPTLIDRILGRYGHHGAVPGLGAHVEQYRASTFAELARWGTTFAPRPVLFQVGFPSDAPWWRALEEPPGELAQALLGAAENTAGVFWVGTTIDEVL